jgi:hypothetical protein
LYSESPAKPPMMVLWGEWFSQFDAPFGFNFTTSGANKPTEIRDMKVSHKFCIIYTSDDLVYSIGKSDFGALGIKGLSDSNK